MSLERALGEDQGVFQKRVDVTEDTELSITDRTVVVGALSANITLTLPPVGEAIGKVFSVHTPTAGTDTQAVTLEDHYNDSVDWNGDFTLDADDDRILLYSDGRAWHVLNNQIA